MAMTKAQQVYAIQRLDQIYKEKLADLKSKYTTPAKKLTPEEKVELAKTRKVSMRDKKTFSTYAYFYDAFDYSDYEYEESLSQEGAKLISELTTKYEDTSDLIMLGDAFEALNAIQNFK